MYRSIGPLYSIPASFASSVSITHCALICVGVPRTLLHSCSLSAVSGKRLSSHGWLESGRLRVSASSVWISWRRSYEYVRVRELLRMR